jgi:large subunit ribosomal protein L9
MAIEVILREDVPNLGAIGEIVRVKPGYARNYLYPHGLAIEANRKNRRVLEHQQRVIGAKADRERKTAEGVASKLDGLAITVRARAGEEGRLFGSVTNLDLERQLAAKGYAIERRRILLEEPIKQLGTYPVSVQVGRNIRATIQVTVESDGESA